MCKSLSDYRIVHIAADSSESQALLASLRDHGLVVSWRNGSATINDTQVR
jgi:hypothetical protein